MVLCIPYLVTSCDKNVGMGEHIFKLCTCKYEFAIVFLFLEFMELLQFCGLKIIQARVEFYLS